MPGADRLFAPPANTRAGTAQRAAQRAIPTIALNTYNAAPYGSQDGRPYSRNR